MIKVQNITSKGQITLPVAWRRQLSNNQIMLKIKENTIEISPVILSKDSEYTTIFDAIRDNKGKGMPAKDVLKILRKAN